MRTPEEQENWRYHFQQANASALLDGMEMEGSDLADQEKVITGEWTAEQYLEESLRQAHEMIRRRRDEK